MENQELVLLERQDGIAIVTLNRPSSLNALSISLRNKLAETFKEIASDGKTKVVILTRMVEFIYIWGFLIRWSHLDWEVSRSKEKPISKGHWKFQMDVI